jgi:hypothetical protein
LGCRRRAQVCRSAGYFEHALAVAQAAGEPEWCLEILLEDCRQFDEALDFLRGLPRPQAAAALHRHGKARPPSSDSSDSGNLGCRDR